MESLGYESVYDESVPKETFVEGLHQYIRDSMKTKWGASNNATIQMLDFYAASFHCLQIGQALILDGHAHQAQRSTGRRRNDNSRGNSQH